MPLLLLLTLLATGCCLSAPETSAHILSASESADDRLAAIQYWRRDLEILPALATLPQTGRLQENPTAALNETCPGPLVHTKPGDIGAGWLHYPKTGGSTVEDVLHLPERGLVRPHRAKVNLLAKGISFVTLFVRNRNATTPHAPPR